MDDIAVTFPAMSSLMQDSIPDGLPNPTGDDPDPDTQGEITPEQAEPFAHAMARAFHAPSAAVQPCFQPTSAAAAPSLSQTAG